MVRGSLKMQMASEVMSNVTRMKDILIPLTTEHHRGSILKQVSSNTRPTQNFKTNTKYNPHDTSHSIQSIKAIFMEVQAMTPERGFNRTIKQRNFIF